MSDEFTPILDLKKVAENQHRSYETVNEGLTAIEDLISRPLPVDVSGGNVSVTLAQIRRHVNLDVAGATTAGRTVTVPQLRRLFTVRSASANTQTWDLVRGSTTIQFGPGAKALVYTDGTADGISAIASSDLPGLGIWQGEWSAGTYQQRDVVRHVFAAWIALQETTQEPSLSATHWQLVVQDGADGAGLTWKGSWSAGAYDENDAVQHLGSAWIANTGTSEEPGPTATDWDLWVQGGVDGADGLSIEFVGEWDPEESYVKGNVVEHSPGLDFEILWYATAPSLDVEPTFSAVEWKFLLAGGEKGDPGDPGPAGFADERTATGSFTFVEGDRNGVVYYTGAGAANATIPKPATHDYPTPVTLTVVVVGGAGEVTFTAEDGDFTITPTRDLTNKIVSPGFGMAIRLPDGSWQTGGSMEEAA